MSAVRRRRGRASLRPGPDPDLDKALEAMTAPELRSFIRTVFDVLHDDQRTTITDSLVGRATRGHAGWRPSPWRGELLDGAALAAQQLRRSDVVQRLEAAWVGAPSLVRLLRWLVAPARRRSPS